MRESLKKLSSVILGFRAEIFAVLVALVAVAQLENIERARIVAEERDRVADQVSILQQQLGSEIIADMHLVEGLRIQLTENPDWTQQDYVTFVDKLTRDHPGIRHIAVAKDYVITYIAPPAGNQQVLGLDYRTVPEQLAAVEEVIDRGHTVITNPVALVQGGMAIIGRVPFFIRQEGDKKIWGLIAIVWDLPELFGFLAEFNSASPYLVAIRSVAADLAEPVMVFGEASVFQQNPVQMVLQIAGNAWEIAAVPEAGWPSSSPSIWMIRFIGLLTTGLLVSLSLGRKRKQVVIHALEGEIKRRQRTSEELRQYAQIVSNSTDMLSLIDQDYVYLAANEAYLRAFGAQLHEVVGNTVAEVFGEAFFTKTIKGPADLCLAGESIRYQDWFDFPVGGRKYMDVTYSPYLGPNGEVCGFVVNAKDDTERWRAETALRESEKRFRTVFDTIEAGTLVIDTSGIIQIFNPAAEAIFGYQSDETVGKNVSILMPEPDRSRHDDYIRSYTETGRSKIIGVGRQVTGLRKNGQEFPMQLEIGEMKVEGHTCFVGSVSDLTELQSLESQLRQAQKLEAVGQLTGGIAHDFNNLLAVIQGNLSLLAEDLTAPNKAVCDDPMEMLEPALAASKRGAELTQRLLAFSRRQTLQPRVLSLNDLVTGMEDMLRRTLGETIDLRVMSKSTTWRVLIDPSQLENCILNLALNARDAMPDGGCLTIETEDVLVNDAYVTTHPGSDIGEFTMLAVSDTGVGMTAAVMDKVFEPFFTTKGVGKGSGLGLSMVHGFVKQSGGNITIYSEPGEGTSVKLYLPRSLEENERAESFEVVSHKGGHETILVVEDEEEVRLMTARILKRLGYGVHEAENGETALAILEGDSQIDLLLTDVVLRGGMNGPQIAKAAHRIRSGIKIMFMTGYTENAIVHHGRVDEGAYLISKPFSPNSLAVKVREVLDTAS